MVGLRIGLVTAFPPGKNSLNEFGWHTAKDLAAKEEVEEVLLFADRTDAGEPTPVEKVTPIPCWTFNSLSNLFRLAAKIRQAKPDAVVFNLQFATFGDTKIAGGLGLLAPALTNALGIPTGVILHNLVENVDMEDAGFASNKLVARGLTLAGQFLTRSILRADYVALTIPRYVEFLRDTYNADNVVLTPHGAFEHLPQPNYETSSDNRKLLAFGKWGTYKTVDTLIDAYRLLQTKPGFEDVQVVIAGTDSPNTPGYLEGAAERCRDLPGVIFTGYVEEDDVAGLFTSCTTTVFPYTSTTGSSGVLHQAGSYGCSAVLPEIGDFAEVIEEEGFIGQYFEPGSVKSLAAAIEELLVNKELRAEMGRRNFAAASTIPFAEVLDWHLLHLEPLIKAKSSVDG